jgi:hypothetical protein
LLERDQLIFPPWTLSVDTCRMILSLFDSLEGEL